MMSPLSPTVLLRFTSTWTLSMSRVSTSSPAPSPFSIAPFLIHQPFRKGVRLSERHSFRHETVAYTVRFDADARIRQSS